jgi:hypothetical protein
MHHRVGTPEEQAEQTRKTNDVTRLAAAEGIFQFHGPASPDSEQSIRSGIPVTGESTDGKGSPRHGVFTGTTGDLTVPAAGGRGSPLPA